jgi:hypothetical protein
MALEPQGGEFVQILNINGNHWITISNIGCKDGHLYVYDTRLPAATKRLLHHTGNAITLHYCDVQWQSGSDDSGLFAIAFVVTLCSGGEPCKQDILPEQIEGRLKKCLITIALSGKSESEKTCHETCKGRIFPSFVCADSLMWARSWFYAKGAIGGITQIVLKSQKVPFKEVHIRLFL